MLITIIETICCQLIRFIRKYIRDRREYSLKLNKFLKMELNRRFAICWISLLFCVIIHWTFGEEFEEIRTVETTLGKIRGKRNITWINNEVYYSFQGIPYAKTPVGNLRLRVSEYMERLLQN